MTSESTSVVVGDAATRPAAVYVPGVTTPSRKRPFNADVFYGALSLVVVFIVFVGFAPTFYLRTMFNGEAVPPLNVIHGVLATVWIALVPVQAFLMRARQKTLHRYLGWTNVAVAAATVVVAPVVMVRFVPRLLARFGEAAQIPAAQIFISDLIALPLFVGMLTAAILNRRHPVVHRRWIMYATLMLATPAPGRAGFLLGVGFVGLLVIPLLTIVCAIFDRRTIGTVHPSTKFAIVAAFAHAIVPIVLSAFEPVVRLVLTFA
jgi:hypothetical protein